MSNPNIMIIVATHKKYKMPEDSIYFPLHVGAEGKVDDTGAPLDFGYQKDNTGDNISIKNPCFGTQTALYWAWKNLSDVDYVGLVHYRRQFTGEHSKEVLSGQELIPILNTHRIVLPKKRHYYIESVYSHYAHTMNGGAQELDHVRDIISELTPEYLDCYKKFVKQRSAYIFNMMIMEKALFDDYCSWLFKILFELERRVDTTGMNDFDKRYGGRVSERLLNIWLMHKLELGELKKTDIKELPYTEEVNWVNKVKGFLAAKFFHKKYGSSF